MNAGLWIASAVLLWGLGMILTSWLGGKSGNTDGDDMTYVVLLGMMWPFFMMVHLCSMVSDSGFKSHCKSKPTVDKQAQD